jgi:hypothetical protein
VQIDSKFSLVSLKVDLIYFPRRDDLHRVHIDSKFMWRGLQFNRQSRDIGRRSDCLSRVRLGNFRRFGTMLFSQTGVPPKPTPGG